MNDGASSGGNFLCLFALLVRRPAIKKKGQGVFKMLVPALFLSGLFLSCLPASLRAHNVVAGAYVDGMVIEGEIGLSNGEAARSGVRVDVFDDGGIKVGETRIGDDGLFTFTAQEVQKYRLKANLGAGHIADIIVEASEFSSDQGADKAPVATQKVTHSTPVVTDMSVAELESMVRRAVAQQVKPLQKELRAYKEKVMIRDIAGGLGFIFGLFGVAAWMTSRKRQKPEHS